VGQKVGGEYLAKLQARAWLSHALCTPGEHTAKTKKVHETITFLLATLPNITDFKKSLTDSVSNKPFLIWLLTTRHTLNM